MTKMDETKFKMAFSQSRNGAAHFIRHPLVRKFAYSDGVQECAEAGCYWLLDIAATEIPAVMLDKDESLVTLRVAVEGTVAMLTLYGSGDVFLGWKKKIHTTDMPEGVWEFLIADEGDGDTPFRMILVSEY